MKNNNYLEKNDWKGNSDLRNLGSMIHNDRRRLDQRTPLDKNYSPSNNQRFTLNESRRLRMSNTIQHNAVDQQAKKTDIVKETIPRPRPKVARKTLDNGWIITDKLGSGGFGDVYKGEHLTAPVGVCAIKVEKKSVKGKEVLPFENHIYQRLQGFVGFPDLFFFSSDVSRHYLGIQKLHGSLDDRFKKMNRMLHSTVIARICLQFIERLEVLHDIGYIHRDLKPHNFLVDEDPLQENNFTVFLIDFGLSKSYIDKNGNHIPYRTDRKFMGTLKYAPINAQLGVEQSRRDDLESLGYVMIYLMNKGAVPWVENKKLNKEENRNWILEQKRNMCIEELCAGFPPYLRAFFEYISMLEYEERPDYKYMRAIIRPYTKQRYPRTSKDRVNKDRVMERSNTRASSRRL